MKKKGTISNIEIRPSFDHDDRSIGTWLFDSSEQQGQLSILDDLIYGQEDEDISVNRDYFKLKKQLEEDTHIQISRRFVRQQMSFVESSRIWDGTVMAVREGTFTARLEDVSGVNKSRIVVMKKTLINKQDWDTFFHKGFEFQWVFQRINTNGTIKNKKEIRFTPIPKYQPKEVEELVNREMEAFAYLFEKTDD